MSGSRSSSSSKSPVSQSLVGKTALVVGGNSGIGREVALSLACRGAQVWIIGRDENKGAAVVRLAQERGATFPITFVGADLSLTATVRTVAQTLNSQCERLDFLVHSAGVHHLERTLTCEGIETNFAVNYLNRFLLSNLLLPRLQESGAGRIVVVGSPYVFNPKRFLTFDGLSEDAYLRPVWALMKAGMAVSVWTIEMARRLSGSGVSINTLRPGVVRTDILRHDPPLIRAIDRLLQPFVSMSATQGAQGPLYLATSAKLKGVSGCFYRATYGVPQLTRVPQGTYDVELGQRLWAWSESLAARSL